MAKFGEGDARWIVQDVGDASANDNGWHWKEYDALDWSNKRLGELFKDLYLIGPDAPMSLRITSLQSCEGEAFINNRKQKLIPSYELEIKLWWAGEMRDGDGKVASVCHGHVHLPYIADENHDEEPEIKFVCETADAASARFKEEFLNKGGKKKVKEVLDKFVTELRAGAFVRPGTGKTAGFDAPSGSEAKPSASGSAAKAAASGAAASATAPAPKAAEDKKGTRSLSMQEKFYARPSDVYECFTVEGKIKAFTQSNASVAPKVGGTFSWFSGSVHGEFLEMEQDKKLVMKWRFNTWADDVWSKVVITLEAPEPGTTILKLSHTDIPEGDKFGQPVLDTTENGWRRQILTRIRQVFGYGV